MQPNSQNVRNGGIFTLLSCGFVPSNFGVCNRIKRILDFSLLAANCYSQVMVGRLGGQLVYMQPITHVRYGYCVKLER